MTPLNLKNLSRHNLDPKFIFYGLVIDHLKKGQSLDILFEKQNDFNMEVLDLKYYRNSEMALSYKGRMRSE